MASPTDTPILFERAVKALFIDQPGKTSIRDVPEPTPGPGEALVRIHTVGLCGTDLATYRGLNPLVSYPRIPGHEVGGTIAEVGADVPPSLSAGTRVTLSPYTSCDKCRPCQLGRENCCRDNQTFGVQRDGLMTRLVAIEWQKLFVSDTLPLRELALVEPLTIGFHAVDRGQVTDADTVAIFGAGAIGLGAISGAARRGARVLSIDLDNAKLALAKEAGAAETVNSASEDLHSRLGQLTGGHGPDVIIEAVGSPATYRAAVDEVSFAGRVVCIGYAKQPVEYETKYFVMKELDIRGSRNATPDDFRAVIGMLEEGAFPVDKIITRTVSMEEGGRALAERDGAPNRVAKIQVDIEE